MNEFDYFDNLLAAKKELRPGTSEYKTTNMNSIDFSMFKYALQRFSQSGEVFVRNSNINKQILIQDPKIYHRKTLDTLHYHEYYIDYNYRWQDFPRRYNSLMFLSYNMYDHYADFPTDIFGKYSYFVFPENNSKIGIAIGGDFIESFDYAFTDLYDLNAIIRRMYIDIMNKDLSPTSYEDWVYALDEMQGRFRENAKDMQNYTSIDTLARAFGTDKDNLTLILKSGDFLVFLESLLGPKNEFYWINCNAQELDYIEPGAECWTDGTCLLIKTSVFDKLTQPGKNNFFDKINKL